MEPGWPIAALHLVSFFFSPKRVHSNLPSTDKAVPLQMKGLNMTHHPVQEGATFIALNAFIVSLFPFCYSSRHADRDQGFWQEFRQSQGHCQLEVM